MIITWSKSGVYLQTYSDAAALVVDKVMKV